MTEHTPGPWVVDGVRDINGAHLHIGSEGRILSLASMNPMHVDTEANARLIAAAPCLLEALKAAEEWLDGWASAEPYICVIRAAIAKAEGK